MIDIFNKYATVPLDQFQFDPLECFARPSIPFVSHINASSTGSDPLHNLLRYVFVDAMLLLLFPLAYINMLISFFAFIFMH